MAKRDQDIGQPKELPSVSPDRFQQGSGRDNSILHTEIAKIEANQDHNKVLLGEVRADIKDVRDRLARLEVKVDHLPGKGFIISALIATLTIASILFAIAVNFQHLFGSSAHAP